MLQKEEEVKVTWHENVSVGVNIEIHKAHEYWVSRWKSDGVLEQMGFSSKFEIRMVSRCRLWIVDCQWTNVHNLYEV